MFGDKKIEEMNSNQETSENDLKYNQNLDDQVDFRQVFDSLCRNKRLIILFTLSGIVLSGLIAFTTKRVWKGEFQIVLQKNLPGRVESTQPNLENFGGLVNGNQSLRTEVGILKSPSILINIFEFVKSKKGSLKNQIEKSTFRDWKDQLDINLERGTSILNISYVDTDKQLILPVLDRISTTYQEYSGRNRRRGIELGIDYFEEQIKNFKNKSIKSTRKAQQFAFDQDLGILPNESKLGLDIKNTSEPESIRLAEVNKIRVVEQNLEKIDDLKSHSEQIRYLASTIPSLSTLSNRLALIDSRLANLRSVYKEEDKTIQTLLNERILIIELLKKQVKVFLLAEKSASQSRLRGAERPEGVLMEYKQLLNEAIKDQLTLDKLENQYRDLLLEKARSDYPWELITTPTLLPNSVAPRRKRMLAFGLVFGSFFGCGAAFISDKRKGIVFSMIEMEIIGNWPLLAALSFNEKQSCLATLDLLSSGPLSEIDGDIALLLVGEIGESVVKYLDESLRNSLKNRKLLISKDFREASRFSNLIIVTMLGITKRKELLNLRKNLLILNKKPLGSLVFK